MCSCDRLSIIKDKKGTENVTADHLSRIENDETSDDREVDDNFPGETLMEINTRDELWFADFANYLVSDIIPKGMMYQQKNKFFSDLKRATSSKYVLTCYSAEEIKVEKFRAILSYHNDGQATAKYVGSPEDIPSSKGTKIKCL
ncbi:hypothetical protein Tco_0762573 [Tanacetum coccineum]